MNPDTYIKNNPNCEETHATFRIVGDQVNPQSISEIFKIHPSFSHAKGDKYQSRSGTLTRKTGVWGITSENKLDSTSLERHVRFLLNILDPVSTKLKDFLLHDQTEVDFLCYWMSGTGHGGPVFSADLLAHLSQLCNTVNFDYYGPYESD